MTYLEFYDLYIYCKGILDGTIRSKSVISPGVGFDIFDPTFDDTVMRDACGRIVYIFENANIATPIIEK